MKRISIIYQNAWMKTIAGFDFLEGYVEENGKCICQIEYDFSDSIINSDKKEIKIEYEHEYFNELYEKLMKLNFNEILLKDGTEGLDGTSLVIRLAHGSNNLNFHIWCHTKRIEKRSLVEINDIFNGLLKKFKIDINLE